MRMGVWIVLGIAIAVSLGLGLRQARSADRVNDPYLWLEDIHGAKPLGWVKQENARTLQVLAADPDYQADYDALLKVLDADDRIPFGGLDHQYVFNFWQDAAHVRGIWRRAAIASYNSANPQWETLLDLDKIAADEKENWVWEGADCAPSLKHCLITLSRGGGDAHVVREFDLNSKSFMKDGFTLPEAKSNITYVDEDTVLFCTDFGPGTLTASGYPRIVKLWKRGQAMNAAKTVYEGKVSDVAATPSVFRTPDGTVALVDDAPSFFQDKYFYVKADGSTLKLPLPLFAAVKGASHGQLIFTLREDWKLGDKSFAKGALLAMPLGPFVRMDTMPAVYVMYVPGPRSSIDGAAPGGNAVYASIYDNVVGSVYVFRFDPAKSEWSHSKLALPAGGSATIIGTNDWGPEAHFSFESFTTPTTLYAEDGKDHPQPIKTLPARFDATGLITEQFEATSKDGTKIPYFVVRHKDASGPQPTILYGYGGFEISETPAYSAAIGKLWLAKGGTYALANIRGGGEFGPAWHDAALLTHRQRAFDDFAAVAEDLAKRGLTTPRQLGIMGGSNGGLLVSTVMTQRPELMGAVVCAVPLVDMIRYTQIGAGASWAAEYGDPADPKMRKYILTYSPYQNVSAKKKYPPVLFWTATSDDRVTPVHARKMAAKMRAQGHDVMFFENTDGGHSSGANHKQQAQMNALAMVYFKRKLGLPPSH